MKKLSYLLFACILCGALVFTACSGESQEKKDETSGTKVTETESARVEPVETEAAEAEVSQADIEKSIIGKWIVADRDGQHALTNEKCVFTFVSPTEAYISASFNARPELGDHWMDLSEADVSIADNKVTITRKAGEEATMVDELSISNITDAETQGSLTVKSVENGEETIITEGPIRFVKVNDDYSEDIIGTWEGHCTSSGSVFDDGQEHRWEYKTDGTYVYYEKDGDNWVPGDDTTNEYFVAGNLLCTRWVENGEEYREWWEITIDGNKMNWTALRKDEDGSAFTAAFEMNRVEEDASDLEKEADDLNEAGKKALVEEDYEKALECFQQAAEMGSVKATHNIGYMYSKGYGVEQNDEKAFEYFKKAADQGLTESLYSVGYCYYAGEGVEQNYDEAVKYLLAAAEQGYASAQYWLGCCYYYGNGVEQNYEEAVKYFQLAEDQGNANAQYFLGECYYFGYGVEQNYEKAVKYYQLAADQENVHAQFSLGFCYYFGEGVEQDYEEALKWFQLAADQGEPAAIFCIGECYYEGNGVEKDLNEAEKWYLKALDAGYEPDEEDQKHLIDLLGEGYELNETFTDSAGRTVKVPTEITKVAVSGPLTRDYIFALCPDRLAGTTDGWTEEEKKYIDEKYLDLPELGRIYGSNGVINTDSLKDCGVQVIIDVGESNDSIREDMDEIQKESGIPVVHIQADLKTTGDAFRMLGDLLSMEEEAEELADFCEMVYDRSAAAVEAGEKVSLLYLQGDLGQNVLPKGSYHAAIIDMMAENMAVVDKPSSKGTGNEVGMDQILNWNPDVIIFGPQSIYPTLDGKPEWQSLRAIQEGRYYEVPCGPENWMGNPPSVQRFLGLMWITKLLYPEEAEYDLYEDAAEYYRLFYHYELTKEEYDELVANSIGKMIKIE